MPTPTKPPRNHACAAAYSLPVPTVMQDHEKKAFIEQFAAVVETARHDPAFAAALREMFKEISL